MNIKIDFTDQSLSQQEKRELKSLLTMETKGTKDGLNQMWYLMDSIWDYYGCDNINLDWGKIEKFYNHPVWLLNGLFIEQDNVSMAHRHAISDWLVDKGVTRVVDFGGGFGTLARLIAEKDERIGIHIFEPHPSEFGLKRVNKYANIKMVGHLEKDYDCLVCTDVLEHVPEPLKVFAKMIKCVKIDGYLVIANCFLPVIKCHLPQTFHLRYTFDMFAKLMGLQVVGPLFNSHAKIFRKIAGRKINWKMVRLLELFSRFMFRAFELLKPLVLFFKRNTFR